MKYLGIIQPGRIGDIIICLPIAAYYQRQGYTILWPIPLNLLFSFEGIAPDIQFFGLDKDSKTLVDDSWRILNKLNCNKIIDLAFGMQDYKNQKSYYEFLKSGQKFDVYKYQIAEVPILEKWNLHLNRNFQREDELFNKLKPSKYYIILHKIGSSQAVKFTLPKKWKKKYQVIKINSDITNNLFDWLGLIEKADMLLFVDSCFANLVEQLNLKNKKYFGLRSSYVLTPWIKNEWQILKPQSYSRKKLLFVDIFSSFFKEPIYWGYLSDNTKVNIDP